MNAAQMHPHTPPDLKELQEILRLPLIVFCPSIFNSRLPELIESLGILPASTPVGVLIRIDPHTNIFRKAYSLMLISIRIRILELRWPRRYGSILGKYGIYPALDSPVAIYALGTRAEEYMNDNVLPAHPHGLNGRLRQNIMRAAGFHPSICGVIVVMNKT